MGAKSLPSGVCWWLNKWVPVDIIRTGWGWQQEGHPATKTPHQLPPHGMYFPSSFLLSPPSLGSVSIVRRFNSPKTGRDPNRYRRPSDYRTFGLSSRHRCQGETWKDSCKQAWLWSAIVMVYIDQWWSMYPSMSLGSVRNSDQYELLAASDSEIAYTPVFQKRRKVNCLILPFHCFSIIYF